MNREEMLATIHDRKAPWDIIIIGGDATGLGSAVDAASRGYDVGVKKGIITFGEGERKDARLYEPPLNGARRDRAG